jgi:hypothetical protein
VKIFDIGTLSVGSTVMQVSGTTVPGPASDSVNTFFAHIIAAISRVITAGMIPRVGCIISRGVGLVRAKIFEKTNFQSIMQRRQDYYCLIRKLSKIVLMIDQMQLSILQNKKR